MLLNFAQEIGKERMVSGEVTKHLGLILANFGNIPFHFEDSFSGSDAIPTNTKSFEFCYEFDNG